MEILLILEKFVSIIKVINYMVSILEIKKNNFVHQWEEEDIQITKL